MDHKRLSKTIAHALRHDPERYGLELDAEGWTPVEDLLVALRPRRRAWQNLSEDDLVTMLAQSHKKRYEIQDGKIRAYYGHSVPDKMQKTPVEPPPMLYHGTAPDAAQLILADGLKPMSRQYVHLSTEQEIAQQVGSRHDRAPVILEVRAADAHRAGVAFYHGNEDTWLADFVPPEFILIAPIKHDNLE
jgi:putative RNA 2'-phosphotransferase